MLLIKLLTLVMVLFILASLWTAFYHMMKGKQDRSTLKALTMRIGLSAVLIVALGIAVATGVIKPNHSPIMLPVDGEAASQKSK